MSTNTALSKTSTTAIFMSGAYLFFMTLVLAPYVNLSVFSNADTTTKLLVVAVTAIVAAAQLLFLVPRVPRAFIRNLGKNYSLLLYVSLAALGLSFLLSASLKTSLFGMFTMWENNLLVYLCYLILVLAWFSYFLVLRKYNLEKLVFHTLMTLAVVVGIIYALGEHFIWKPVASDPNTVTRITLGFRNPLLAAYFLGMLWSYTAARTIDLLLQLKQTFSSLAQSITSLVLFVGITFALLFTYTRSAWIAAGLVFLATIILKALYEYRHTKWENFGRLTITSGILFITVFLVGFGYRNVIAQRNIDLTVESQNTLATIAQTLGKEDPTSALDFYQKAANYSSAQIRLLEWEWGVKTWAGSVKNILVGIGADTGFFEMPKFRDPIFNNFPTDYATKPFYVRSLYVNTLMQFGIVFTLGAAAFVFLLLKRAFWDRPHIDHPAAALVLAFFAQGIFYYPTHLTVVLLLFGLAYTLAHDSDPEMITVRVPTAAERLLLVVAAASIIFWMVPIAKAEKVIEQYSQEAIPASQTEMETAATIGINNNVLMRYLVYYYPENTTAQTYLNTLDSSKDIDDLRIAADAYYVLARSKNDKTYAQKSATVLERLLAIDKTLPASWDGLGLRRLYLKNFVGAREAFTQAIALKPDYWYAYMHLGEVSRQQCNPQEALEWYKKAEQYIPSAATEIQEAKDEIKTPRAECK